MQFEKIKRTKFKRKSSFVADQILKQIKNGPYKPGTKLPPERVLAEQMEVGRPSVREAISALQIVGILESRPGDGSYVTDSIGFDELMLSAFDVLEESDSPFDILQVRKAIEIGIIYLAIKMATDEDIQEIKSAWKQKYERGKKGDYAGFIGYGREFHIAIARAAKIQAVEAVMEKLLKITHQPLWVHMRQNYYTEDPTRIEPMLELHNDIMRALEERNAEVAIRLIEKHFDLHLEQHYYE